MHSAFDHSCHLIVKESCVYWKFIVCILDVGTMIEKLPNYLFFL